MIYSHHSQINTTQQDGGLPHWTCLYTIPTKILTNCSLLGWKLCSSESTSVTQGLRQKWRQTGKNLPTYIDTYNTVAVIPLYCIISTVLHTSVQVDCSMSNVQQSATGWPPFSPPVTTSVGERESLMIVVLAWACLSWGHSPLPATAAFRLSQC